MKSEEAVMDAGVDITHKNHQRSGLSLGLSTYTTYRFAVHHTMIFK
jgi:hypothetical protein